MMHYALIEGSVEVKLLTHGQTQQQWREESEKGQTGEKKSEERNSQKNEDKSARKGGKVAKLNGSPMFCGSRGFD